jgi:pyrroline-5-carboxylate reductase
MDSNAAVSDVADIVFLAVRPNQIDEAMESLSFRPGQCVASFLAKTPLQEVKRRAGPDVQVCRVTPLPSIALGKGPVLLLEAPQAVAQVFNDLGDVIHVGNEAELTALGYASGLLSTYFEVQNTIISWLGNHGATAPNASLYVRSMLEGLAATGKSASEAELVDLPPTHETKGGLNERSRRRLLDLGWFGELEKTLDMLDQKVVLGPTGTTKT